MNNVKGQSAIEYLMTYGWMLLVVAVVGGAIFSIVGNQATESVSGFSGTDVLVDGFGVNSEDRLGLDIRDGSGQSIIVSKVNVSDPDTGEYVFKEFTGDRRVEVGDSKIFELPYVRRSDSANKLDIKIIYNSEGLSNLSVSGTISGTIELTQSISVFGPPSGSTGEGTDSSWSEPVSTAPDCSSYPGKYEGSGIQSDPYLVMNSSGLQCMNNSVNSNYALEKNINATGTENWNSGNGFYPVGTSGFSGEIDGKGKEITGIYIERSGTAYMALVSRLNSAEVRNLSINNFNVSGAGSASILAGLSDDSEIKNVRANGEVGIKGNYVGEAGGLAGQVRDTRIINSSFNGTVKSLDDTNKYNVGGFIGNDYGGSTIKGSSAKGLLYTSDGCSNCAGFVSTVGQNTNISDSYTLVDVNGSGGAADSLAGFMSYTEDNNYIDGVYSAGYVQSSANDGGFIAGTDNGYEVINNSYWDNESIENQDETGVPYTDGSGYEDLTPLSTSEFYTDSTQNLNKLFDNSNKWRDWGNNYYPCLKWEEKEDCSKIG